MRLMFSAAVLLIVAALMMWVAKKQLQAVTAHGPEPAASSAQPLPAQVRHDVQRALEQGAARMPDGER